MKAVNSKASITAQNCSGLCKAMQEQCCRAGSFDKAAAVSSRVHSFLTRPAFALAVGPWPPHSVLTGTAAIQPKLLLTSALACH